MLTTLFTAATSQTVVPIYLCWRMTLLFRSLGPASPLTSEFTRQLILNTAAKVAVGGVFWWTVAIYELVMYRKWGRVPKTLEATATILTVRSLGWWWMRTRTWPVTEIKSIKLKTVKDLFEKRTVADLVISFHTRRRLRLGLSSSDASLPGRIRDAIAAITGRGNPSRSVITEPVQSASADANP